MTGFFQSNRTPCLAKAPKPVFRATSVVGRGGLEPPTSRLSGVRSNHLSYRPLYRHKPPKGRFSAYRPAQLSPQFRCGDLQDAGTLGRRQLFFGMEEALPTTRDSAFRQIP